MAIPLVTGQAVQRALRQLATLELPGEVEIRNTGGYPLLVRSIYSNSIRAFVHADADFRTPVVEMYKSRGTEDSPTACRLVGYEQSPLAAIQMGGYDGTEYLQTCGIVAHCSEDFTSTRHGSHITFYRTPVGLNARTSNNQAFQVGGRDASGQVTETGVDTNNISFYPLSFGGNLNTNPMLKPVNSPGGGVSPQISVRTADDSADGDFNCGAAAFSKAFATMTKPRSYTVATLPSASANAGWEAEVTDSSVTTYRSIVAGGGSQRVDVKSNGTNWLVN